MALFSIVNAARKAAMGKEFQPWEYLKIDRLGNKNGHIDFDDMKIIASDAIDELTSLGETVGNVAGDVFEAVGEFLGDTLDFLGDLF